MKEKPFFVPTAALREYVNKKIDRVGLYLFNSVMTTR